ncbi:hypothetical protein LY28_03068 [Ruminiclostridium sufflavum DSM 19573]|uniref:Sgc region protein SgcQ n=1 Tax=Ruminiclostridium sufflavum DSM 19573 TaxID=1121337 RepID=A0A318XLF0_9FIRM|nr:BtpA/SgcQ family protein [Ruminiclostridium sufflavum]PYG85914.1 hypothetical protein LY28_03068 [Ruminiclostridium sufflavum DSM 19573]
MSWFSDMFGTEKPIIGLLHLFSLPGDPFYSTSDSIEKVIEQAKSDLTALQEGGVDGVLITNEFSMPYEKEVSKVALASMAMVIGAIRNLIYVPFGVEAIYDGDATIELCAATGALFTRCLFTGAWAGDHGLVNRNIAKTLRLKSALRLDNLKLFYFVTSEGEVYLNDRSYTDIAQTMLFNCHPDALVVGGTAPGLNPEGSLLEDIKKVAGNTPVVCGTGCNASNVKGVLAVCDGAFVGTTLKTNGKFENSVDRQRVSEFMSCARL